VALARTGNPRAIARVISQVENDATAAQSVIRAVYGDTGRAHLVGITGPPGSGKSTLVNELAKAFRARGRTVAIIAVDPSSPFTGGAILGDRVRMRDLAGDEGIFVRSMASRGSLGGLARATAAVVKVLDAAGYHMILIETVGAGQAEVDIATAAQSTVVLEAPGMGDDVQSIKAGILEIADILVVNKADRPGASRAVRSLEMMLHLGLPAEPETIAHGPGHEVATAAGAAQEAADAAARWNIPVLETVATDGRGIPELAAAIDDHRHYLEASGQGRLRERLRAQREIAAALHDRFVARLETEVPAEARLALADAVAERRLDPASAAEQLLAGLDTNHRSIH
jgi:LAO/AO transport system kinase